MSLLFKTNFPSITNRKQTLHTQYRRNMENHHEERKEHANWLNAWMVCTHVAKYHRAKLGLNTETKSQFLLSKILYFLQSKTKSPRMSFTNGKAQPDSALPDSCHFCTL